MSEQIEEIPFVDETFDVIPSGVISNISDSIASENLKYEDLPPLVNTEELGLSSGVEQEAQVPTIDLGEEDLYFMSEMLWGLPQLAWDKLPDREPKQIAMFNKALYKYCVKKGIDPTEYLFDELGIVLATVTVGVGIKKDYDKYYKGKGINDSIQDKPLTKDEKLNVDYTHRQEIDDIQES